jgi:hypothetical protein
MHFEITAAHDCPTYFTRLDFHAPDAEAAQRFAKGLSTFLGTSLTLVDPSLAAEGRMRSNIAYDPTIPSPARKLGITRDHQ